MRKITITCLALVCLLFTHCQEESFEAKIPEDCQTKDCFEPPRPEPEPVASIPKFNAIQWLETQDKMYQNSSCYTRTFFWRVAPHLKGVFTQHFGILKGNETHAGNLYYKVDIYDNYSNESPGIQKIGTAYVSQSTSRPYYSQNYRYSNRLSILQGVDGKGAYELQGWQVFVYIDSSWEKPFNWIIGGFLIEGCYVFR